MLVRHKNARLARLETDASYTADGAFSPSVIRGFRKVMGWIRNGHDERDLRNLKSLHYEKLEGKRAQQRSMRINDQWRLIEEWEGKGATKTVVIVAIEDYHR